MRLRPALVPGLAVALGVVAWLADRALVGQAVAARRPVPGVTVERLTAAPPRSVPPVGFTPYADRPRAELAELLASTRSTPGGLPVRPEDLPYLASRLGLASDPRVPVLVARLRGAPDATELPTAPGFRRRQIGTDRIEGWTSAPERRLLRYELTVAQVLDGAGLLERVAVAPAGADSAPALSRTVGVPDV